VGDAADLLSSLRGDPAQCVVAADFLNAVDLRNAGVTLSQCSRLFTAIEGLMGIARGEEGDMIEYRLQAAAVALLSLLQGFASIIRDARAVMPDDRRYSEEPSRAERRERAEICAASLTRLRPRLEHAMREYRRSRKMQTLLTQILSHVTSALQ
jgi:hypothetical protein